MKGTGFVSHLWRIPNRGRQKYKGQPIVIRVRVLSLLLRPRVFQFRQVDSMCRSFVSWPYPRVCRPKFQVRRWVRFPSFLMWPVSSMGDQRSQVLLREHSSGGSGLGRVGWMDLERRSTNRCPETVYYVWPFPGQTWEGDVLKSGCPRPHPNESTSIGLHSTSNVGTDVRRTAQPDGTKSLIPLNLIIT